MKLGNSLNLIFRKHRQRGQAIVEFVLLLAVMAAVTYSFVYFMNRNLSRYWEHAANLIIDDRPGTQTVRTNRR